jgi:hypothetical protein
MSVVQAMSRQELAFGHEPQTLGLGGGLRHLKTVRELHVTPSYAMLFYPLPKPPLSRPMGRTTSARNSRLR